MVAGSIAGIANSVVSGPVEHIRIRTFSSHPSIAPTLTLCPVGLQIQQSHNKIYSGPLDAVRKISSSYGITGIYKGQVATLWREAIGYAAYFWAYEKLMQREMRLHGVRRDEVSPAKAVLFGAAAGYAVSLFSLCVHCHALD